MPRRFIRFSLAFALLLSNSAWGLGLGEIRLESALNAPLRAEIVLLSASPEELENLQVALASQATFERYGLERPYFLSNLQFEIVRSGSAQGSVVRVTSTAPITEPFLTFLVEATWSRGRLLREYTVLLDPPTFAPPAARTSPPAVTAPQRSTPTDSARIEREPQPDSSDRPVQAPRPTPPAPQDPPAVSDAPFDTISRGDMLVERGTTLWEIASRVRPDARLSMNQTMLAIYEANPDAFGGNINLLRAGASLRIPSADEIYRIERSAANSEVRRQHAAWGGAPVPPPATADTADGVSRPSLTLVPPDEEPVGVTDGSDDVGDGDEPVTREQELVDRIAEIEAADVPEQRSLLEIRNNELAVLRRELAEIRGEVYEPPLPDEAATDDPFADEEDSADEPLFPDRDEIMVDDTEDADAADAVAADTVQPPSNVVVSSSRSEPSIVDRILGLVMSMYGFIGAVVLIVAGILFWFVRRGRGDDHEPEAWGTPLDSDDLAPGLSGTESLRAPSRDEESIVVVEQGSGIRATEDTVEAPAAPGLDDKSGETGEFGSLEDTFSSETAVNLDQTDPIAEADFHMAYGLYDQAADLINGALEVEPTRVDLLSKLCEIYFVWGNRDAFVDAAERVKSAAGESDGSEWDKIVIMGQQIAGDHALFAGAGVAGATKAVDLSFESDMGEASALDMDFGSDDDGGDDDVIDLGADSGADDDGVDFMFGEDGGEDGGDDDGIDFDVTQESAASDDSTSELPATDPTVETPTIEQQFEGFDSTSELPSISDTLGATVESDATAEIELDDLGLDLDGLEETEVASLDDLDETGLADLSDDLESTSDHDALVDTGINEAIPDPAETTGRNPEVDPDSTGVRRGLDPDSTGMTEALDIEDALAATNEMRLAADETGQNPMQQQAEEDTDVGIDDSLLDATGHTQILSEDLAVETASDVDKVIADEAETLLASLDDDDDNDDNVETMLAPADDDDDDFDFAKTEALPRDVFTGNTDLDETGELPAVASTDVDLDLDDLTAALKVSEMGDTVDMPRDDATVEHVRPSMDDDDTSEVPTMSIAPEDMDDDLHEARTMTEVGTKLDLARAYVDMGDPGGARSILEEVLDEGDESQRQQAQKLLDSLPG